MNRHSLTIGNPIKWPRWPVLPLVRKVNDKLEVGTVVDKKPYYTNNHCPISVFREHCFYMSDLMEENADLEDVSHYTYRSIGELLADGWRVA